MWVAMIHTHVDDLRGSLLWGQWYHPSKSSNPLLYITQKSFNFLSWHCDFVLFSLSDFLFLGFSRLVHGLLIWSARDSVEWMNGACRSRWTFFYDMNPLKRDDLSFGRLPVYIEVVLDDDHTAALELEVVVYSPRWDEMRWDVFEVLSARLTRQLTEYEFQFFAVNLLACLAAAASFLRISIGLITSVCLSMDDGCLAN